MTVTDLGAQLQAALGDLYDVERELTPGGMSRLFLATERSLDRKVVIKLLPPEYASELSAARFQREVTLTAHLQHPHILPILCAGSRDGLLYYVTPYVDGESLRVRLAREKQLPLETAIAIARDIASALEFAHRHGVVHRDVKPENILLAGEEALLADLGIARAVTRAADETLTDAGLSVGTPTYMSPEQASAERDLDGRTDLYSLACVLYEMLAGEPPFTGPSPQVALARRFAGPPPRVRLVRPSVPPAVEDAIGRALQTVRADRFATLAEFARALSAGAPRPAADRSRRAPMLLIALAALAVGAALAGFGILSRRGRNQAVAVGAGQAASIAVLPFANVSAEKENEYFSDGMTEELINALSKVDGLRVVSRTSAFAFKGKNQDVAEIGRKLRVGSMVEGSVRRVGDRLRVTAQLVDVTTGYHLWSDSYDRELKDVFAVQDELARAIVAALRPRLAGGGASLALERSTTDLDAYDFYLKGRYAWNQRNPGSLMQAAHFFEQAIARDPQFARAYAGLADVYILLPNFGSVAPSDVWPKARAAAERALVLDSSLAEAHASLGLGKMYYDWDWKGAERELRKAIALNPRYPTGRQWYADFLGGRGRLAESVAEMQRAEALDPLSPVISVELGRALYFMHRYADAEAQVRQTIQLDPNFAPGHVWLGLVFLQEGRVSEALPELRRERDLSGRVWLGMAGLVCAYSRLGQPAEAAKQLAELTERARRGYVPPTAFVFAYTGLGDRTQAFRWLDTAVNTRDQWLPENFFDPLMDSLRADPRFTAIRHRMGLE